MQSLIVAGILLPLSPLFENWLTGLKELFNHSKSLLKTKLDICITPVHDFLKPHCDTTA